jgi:hypothetical protein
MRTTHAAAALLLGLAAAQAAAQGADSDKSRYTLFNPTPRDLWRPMETDRPDITESARTVDAGVFQLETGIVLYGNDRRTSDGVDADTVNVLQLNLRTGILNNVEIDLLLTAFAWERTDPPGGPSSTSSGFPDVVLRSKINLWGNDEGTTALAVVPTLIIPTGGEVGSSRVGGGVLVPFTWDFAEGWSFGAQVDIEAVHDKASDDYDLFFLQTLALGFDITDRLGGYTEYVGTAWSDGRDYEASFSGGVTYALSDDLQLDAGVLIGLTRAAEDFAVFTGLSVRF